MQSLVTLFINSYLLCKLFFIHSPHLPILDPSWSHLLSMKPGFYRMHLPARIPSDFLLCLAEEKERKVVMLRFWKEAHFSVVRAPVGWSLLQSLALPELC